jgi:hypothetical protein
MDMSKINAANSTAICGGEKPAVRNRGADKFDIIGLFGESMFGPDAVLVPVSDCT